MGTGTGAGADAGAGGRKPLVGCEGPALVAACANELDSRAGGRTHADVGNVGCTGGNRSTGVVATEVATWYGLSEGALRAEAAAVVGAVEAAVLGGARTTGRHEAAHVDGGAAAGDGAEAVVVVAVVADADADGGDITVPRARGNGAAVAVAEEAADTAGSGLTAPVRAMRVLVVEERGPAAVAQAVVAIEAVTPALGAPGEVGAAGVVLVAGAAASGGVANEAPARTLSACWRASRTEQPPPTSRKRPTEDRDYLGSKSNKQAAGRGVSGACAWQPEHRGEKR